MLLAVFEVKHCGVLGYIVSVKNYKTGFSFVVSVTFFAHKAGINGCGCIMTN